MTGHEDRTDHVARPADGTIAQSNEYGTAESDCDTCGKPIYTLDGWGERDWKHYSMKLVR
jgi:hypothetical protein